MKRVIQLVVLGLVTLFACEPVLADALLCFQPMRPACAKTTNCCGMIETNPAAAGHRFETASVFPVYTPANSQDSTGCKPDACSYRVPQSVAVLTAPGKSASSRLTETPANLPLNARLTSAPAPSSISIHGPPRYLLLRVFRV